MTGRAAILTLRVMTKKPHSVGWELTGGGHGEPGGVWYPADHCERLVCGLTDVTGEDATKPCTCGAEAHNQRIEDAINTLLEIIKGYDKAVDIHCTCFKGQECEHCDLVISARVKMEGEIFLNPDGN